MAWEMRGKSTYYYRTGRVGKKVCRDYMGCGSEAQLSAELDVQRRERCQAERAGWADFVSEVQAADGSVADLNRHCQLLASAVFLISGFHNHNGEWRRRRVYKHKRSAD
jgi:hypothetical protein